MMDPGMQFAKCNLLSAHDRKRQFHRQLIQPLQCHRLCHYPDSASDTMQCKDVCLAKVLKTTIRQPRNRLLQRLLCAMRSVDAHQAASDFYGPCGKVTIYS